MTTNSSRANSMNQQPFLRLNEDETKRQPAGRTIRLPCYGITVTLLRANAADRPGGGSIVSDLRAAGKTVADRRYNAAIDGLESLILAHACAGVDVQSPAYIEGIETAVEAIANHVS
jgi:hypothetical protein